MQDATFAEVLELTHPTAEASTLAGMMANQDLAIEIGQALEPTDFHNERYAVIFEAIRSILHGLEPVDKPGIVAECRRITQERKLPFQVTESHLEFTGDPKRALSYAQTVKRLAWLRGAAGFAHWMIQELQAHPDPETLYLEAQEKWTAIKPTVKASSFVYGWDTVGVYEEVLRERIKGEDGTTRCDWPWRSWNKLIRWLRPGMVGTLAAPDGMGKSVYLEMVAEHWAMMSIQTVYVHLEDDLEYKLDRRMARFACVPIDAIEDGKLTEQQFHAVRDAEERLAGFAANLHYYHAPGKSMTEIIRELETRVSEGVCHAVVFDYIDKCQVTRAQARAFGTNTWERQADDMEQLKSFAERNKVVVFTATQGNKSMQGGGTQTRQSIQGSGQKSQKSQLVVILTRDLVEDDNGLTDGTGIKIADKGDYSPIVNVRVDKQNRGRTGQFQQVIAGRFFTVKDMETRSEPG
jgi:replicative DNA helicase